MATVPLLVTHAEAEPVQGEDWEELFKGCDLEPRQVSGRLTLKGGAPLDGWTVSATSTRSSMAVSAREGLPVTTDSSGAFSYPAPVAGWIQLRIWGPWATTFYAEMSRRLTPDESVADFVVDGYLLQVPTDAVDSITAEPIIWSNEEIGRGWTDKPPTIIQSRGHGGTAKVLVHAGLDYLVTGHRPGRRPLVAIIEGDRPASIIDIDFQESLPSLATFKVTRPALAEVRLDPIRSPGAPVCTPRKIRADSAESYGVALPGRYMVRVTLPRASMVRDLFVAPAPPSEIVLRPGVDAAIVVTPLAAGAIELLSNLPSDLPRNLQRTEINVEIQASGTSDWHKVRLLTRTPGGRLVWSHRKTLHPSYVFARSWLPGKYRIRANLPGRVPVEASVLVEAGAVSKCTLVWR